MAAKRGRELCTRTCACVICADRSTIGGRVVRAGVDVGGWWLGAVRDGCHGEGGLVQEALAGEELARVAVGAHAEEEHVEPGSCSRRAWHR